MKIILAAPTAWLAEQANITYPAEAGVSGDADETIDAPDGVAQRLLAEGLARLPDTVPSTHSELDAVAAAEGIDLSGARTVADKSERVRAARTNK
jgi:hypothetical protein